MATAAWSPSSSEQEPDSPGREEAVCRMSVEVHTQPQQLHKQTGSRRRSPRLSLASLPKAAVTRAAISLKRVKLTKDSTAQFAVFMLKVGALELLRRGAQQRFPHLWWALQGIPLFQAPPLVWLQRWAPFRYLIQGSQIFSKPVVFLSIATALTNVLDDRKQNDNIFPAPPSPSRPVSPRQERASEDREESEVALLRQELENQGIVAPDRMSNDELQRFFLAANGSTKRFVALVKKTLRWRESFRFLSGRELDEWSQLVYWHHHDAQGRPLLIIRLGLAASTLVSAQRPRFAQAIVSQIEYGVLNLVCGEDPRITVVLDCAGAPSVGFPLHMTKSCCVLVQENYPTRLAALFIVNLPPFVRVVANAIVQILKPATREKVYVESEDCAAMLAEHLGGMDWVPIYLGGSCKCSLCNEARAAMEECTSLSQMEQQSHPGHGNNEHFEGDLAYLGDDVTPYQSCTGVIRVSIVALLMLWIVVALIAGFYDPQLEPIPT